MIGLIRKLLSKLDAWQYVLYAATSSLMTAAKGYMYSHLLSPEQYAEINFYLLVLGFGGLIAGAGVVLRCHTELPLLVAGPDKLGVPVELSVFLGNARGIGLLTWFVMVLMMAACSYFIQYSVELIVLSLVQVILFLFFMIDILVDKSRKNFSRYSRQLLLRNASIAGAGLLAAIFWGEAEIAVRAEVLACSILCLRSMGNWLRGTMLPSKSFLVASLGLLPVTVMGGVLQYVDKLLASVYMTPMDFSRYSYLSLIVMIGSTIQQLVNTRVITLLPELCRASPVEAFKYVLKVAFFSFFIAVLGSVVGMLLLTSEMLSADWVEFGLSLCFVFVVFSAIRAVDFFSGYLLALGGKGDLFLSQVISIFFLMLFFFLYDHFIDDKSIEGFALVMSLGFGFSFLVGLVFCWRRSVINENPT